jgi:uncharacterized protein (TIGR02453 family)
MGTEQPFDGFPRETLEFLRGLRQHNDKVWFEAHRKEHEAHVMAPSRAFVVAMGSRLTAISKGIVAEPRVNGSIFRINRDTRFSKDKSPYKTNLAFVFWEGERARMECPSFYFHLEPDSLMLGAGIYLFPKPLLEAYRKAVVDPKLGPALRRAVAKVPAEAMGKTGCGMTPDRYKKVPAGYDPGHESAELLKNKGLTAGIEVGLPKGLHSRKLVDYCFDRYEEMAPIHHWLVAMTARA